MGTLFALDNYCRKNKSCIRKISQEFGRPEMGNVTTGLGRDFINILLM